MSQCTRIGPKTRGQCSKFEFPGHEEHHSLETGEKWNDIDALGATLERLKRITRPLHVQPPGRPIVIIESPHAGDVARNLAYVRAAMRDCLQRGEAPYTSHALYTQPGVLDDSNPAERRAGIDAGFVFRHVAAVTMVYTDLGVTPGMVEGIRHAEEIGCLVEYRTVPGWKWESAPPQRCPVCGQPHRGGRRDGGRPPPGGMCACTRARSQTLCGCGDPECGGCYPS